MAKWGEGDPRWIVEERPDATNVNNWHWSEKNASDWSRGKIKSLFNNLKLEVPKLGTITISEVSKCDGEATANNRKGKLIFFYEWAVEMDWSSEVTNLDIDGDEITKGKIEIVNLSEENTASEIEIDVSISQSGTKSDAFKEHIRKEGLKVIREKIGDYIQSLKAEYATDLILPTKNQDQAQTKQSRTVLSQEFVNNVKNIKVSSVVDTKSSVKFETTSLSSSQSFKCTPEEIYRVFTVREMVVAFTRNDVKLEAEKGGQFELFGGNVTGEFVELKPGQRIVQKWRFKTWPQGHFSEVTLDIVAEAESTRIDIKQTGVPTNDLERTKVGWQNYYWDAIKRTFGFGAHLI